MTTTQAAAFVIETVQAVKMEIIKTGQTDPEFAFAACKKLSVMLDLPLDMVIDIMTK